MSQTNKLRILHFSPHDEDCGIATYEENYFKEMAAMPEVENVFFDTSPLATIGRPSSELNPIMDRLTTELQDFDILHIQHDFSLYSAEFPSVVAAGKKAGKKIIVSMHASPVFFIQKDRLHGIGPHSVMHYLKQQRFRNKMIRFHIAPLSDVDLILVHDEATKKGLQSFGLPEEKVKKLPHPVYELDTTKRTSDVIAKALNKQPGDVIFGTVGYMHKFKGVFDAVKALHFLPENYKLAIVGGLHPTTDDVEIYNRVCDLINSWGLRERVYIAGNVQDDDEFDSLIRECDICVYPYDGKYYSHVSSGALNRGLANGRPIIAYPTETFKEVAARDDAIVLTQTFAYYELARELQRLDTAKQAARAEAYAQNMGWAKLAGEMVSIYQGLAEK